MNKQFILNKVKRILRSFKADDLYELADFLNITILEDDLGEMGGFYFYVVKHKLILLNCNLSEAHKRIVLAHEISHAILHTKLNCAFYKKCTLMITQKIENEANYCGALLLKELNILDDEMFCIYTKEITEKDEGFINIMNELKAQIEQVC